LKNFPQTPFAAFVTNIRYGVATDTCGLGGMGEMMGDGVDV